MDIKEQTIKYAHGTPCDYELCRVFSEHPHFHTSSLEIIFCLKGKVNLTAGHQNVVINEGDVFSVDYRDIHRLYSDVDNLVLIFHINLKSLKTPWDYIKHVYFSCESCHCFPYQEPAMEKIKDIILSCSYLMSINKKDALNTSKLQNASNNLIDILFKYFNWCNYNNQDDYVNIEHYNRFHRVLAYCNENYMNKISISQLAEMEHINVNYFSQFINKTVFEKFRYMLQYIRCYEAEQLLLKTDLPIAEISYKCGFSDPKYFYSAFKQWWGCSPTEHRKKYLDYTRTSKTSIFLSPKESEIHLKDYITKWTLEKTLK